MPTKFRLKKETLNDIHMVNCKHVILLAEYRSYGNPYNEVHI